MFRRCISSNYRDVFARHQMAMLFMKMGREREAETVLKKILQYEPGNVPAISQLDNLYARWQAQGNKGALDEKPKTSCCFDGKNTKIEDISVKYTCE